MHHVPGGTDPIDAERQAADAVEDAFTRAKRDRHDVKAKLVQTFTKDATKDRMVQLGICKDTDHCQVTSDASIWGYSPVTDATFDTVRKVCAATKNENCAKA